MDDTLTLDHVRRAMQWLKDNDGREPDPWILTRLEFFVLFGEELPAGVKPGEIFMAYGHRVMLRPNTFPATYTVGRTR